MALGKPRSSLLRSGVAIHNAVWDAGYQGRSQALLVVYHPRGFTLSRDARVLQLVFFLLAHPVDQGTEAAIRARASADTCEEMGKRRSVPSPWRRSLGRGGQLASCPRHAYITSCP